MLPCPVYVVMRIQFRVLCIVGELCNDGVTPPISKLCFKMGPGKAVLDGPEDPVPVEGRGLSISRFFWGLNGICPLHSAFCSPHSSLLLLTSLRGFSSSLRCGNHSCSLPLGLVLWVSEALSYLYHLEVMGSGLSSG